MKMKQVLFLLGTLLLCTSCFTTYQASKQSDYTNEFVGKTHNYIVSSWGAPTRQTSDGNGGTILIYEQTTAESTSVARNGYYNPYNGTYTYTPGVNTSYNTSYAQFYIDPNGKCYRVNTNHQKEWKEFSVAKTILLAIPILALCGLSIAGISGAF